MVKDIFAEEEAAVVLFGSRARGDYLETSDIDIGILPKGTMNKNKLNFAEGKDRGLKYTL
jgi:hypothetical protein